MYELTLPQMQEVFGGVNADRRWRLIRGQRGTMPETRHPQIGRPIVLALEFRSRQGRWSVACRLLEKAATRMRQEGYQCGRLCVAVSDFDGSGWTKKVRFSPVSRTSFLQGRLVDLWAAAEREGRGVPRPTHVSVCLLEILPDDHVIPSLFEGVKQIALDRAVDGVNDRWGRGTVTAAAMASKAALDHGRIPFGMPTEYR